MSYSKVSYIKVNRTYFNIGYTATSTTRLYIKFKPHTGGSGNYDSTNTYIIGRGYTGNREQFSINCYYNSRSTTETLFRFRYYCGNSYNDNFILNCPTEEIYEGTLSSTGVSINGGGKSSATTFSSTFTSSPIYLLGGQNEGNGFAGVVTLYEASIYENDVLVRHYIPYKDNETGYGVVYEEITGTYLNGVVPSDVIAGDPIFWIEPNTISFQYSGASSALTITCDGGWTASTNDSWLTLSSTSGIGNSAITITASANNGSQRNGVVSVTDGSDTLTCTISQDKHPVSVKSDNIYFEDTRVNKMYLNGSLIYRNLIPTVVFDVDESSETIEYTGGTFNFTVNANKLWTITSPEWVTLSKTSGYSTNTITATVGQNPSADTQRTGTITVSCNNTSKTISLTQSSDQHDYSSDYLTLNILTGGTIMWRKNNNSSPSVTISYSINNGNWVDITSDYGSSAPTIIVDDGDKVRIKGNNNAYCATATTTGATTKNNYNFFSGDTSARYNVYGNIMSLIYGDNFIGNNEFPDTNGWNFKSLFEGNKNVVSAKNLILPPTTLYMSSFRALFSNATNLVEGPELLAPTLAPACYSYIFGTTKITYVKCLATDISAAGCLYNWLTTVPSSGTFVKKAGVTYPSGASGIPNGWTVEDAPVEYKDMYLTFEIISGGKFVIPNYNGYNFSYSIDNGTTWTTIPFVWGGIDVSEGDKIMLKGDNQIIGDNLGWWSNTAEFVVYGNIMSIITSTGFTTANTVSNNAFKNLFYYCNSLTSAENLVLPATTLAESCYENMFQGCPQLTTAPELPAATLANSCYSGMFQNCTSLNYIKCLATDISATNCTYYWVNNVSASGTFVKNPNMSGWTTDQNGIPNGWTVIDA